MMKEQGKQVKKKRREYGEYRKRRVTEKIAEWSCYSDKAEEYEIILYGMEVIFQNITKTVILLLVGILVNRVWDSMLIILCFGMVRIHAGGIHAKSSIKCTIMMLLIEVCALMVDKFLVIQKYVYFGIIVVVNICVWLYAPNGNKSLEFLEEVEKRQKKKKAMYTLNIFLVVSFWNRKTKLVCTTVLIEAITIVAVEIEGRWMGGRNK